MHLFPRSNKVGRHELTQLRRGMRRVQRETKTYRGATATTSKAASDDASHPRWPAHVGQLTKHLIAALAVLTAFSPDALAQRGSTVPLVPHFKPAKAKEFVSRFHDALVAGLRQSGVKTPSGAMVRAKASRPCASARCATAAIRRLAARSAVGLDVQTVGKNYRFTIRSLPRGRPVLSGRCDICTLIEAVSKARRLAEQLGAILHKGQLTAAGTTGRIKRREPSSRGRRSPRVAKKPKTHGKDSAVVLPGSSHPKTAYPKVANTKAATTGDPETGDTSSPSGKTFKQPRRWPLWPAAVAGGVGVLGLAVGLPLLSIDGEFSNCRGEPRPDGRNCEAIYATSGPGWAMTAIGVAGLATAGVLVYLYITSGARPDSTRSTMTWIPQLNASADGSGWTFGAIGRF